MMLLVYQYVAYKKITSLFLSWGITEGKSAAPEWLGMPIAALVAAHPRFPQVFP